MLGSAWKLTGLAGATLSTGRTLFSSGKTKVCFINGVLIFARCLPSATESRNERGSERHG
jgi:hypothetical protein